jgi:hypothetical protein
MQKAPAGFFCAKWRRERRRLLRSISSIAVTVRRICESPRRSSPICARRHALARDYTGGLPACAAAGFGELWEALILSVQTPLFAILMKQHYRRAGADKRHILFAEFEELEDLEGALGGRLFDIWDRQAAGAPRQ